MRHARDLRILVHAMRPEAKVIFAMQPFAPVMARQPCQEEQRLFALTSAVQGYAWQRLEEELRSLWSGYVERLEAYARQERVAWIDLNQASLSGWSFVDQAHLTDHGYQQAAECLARQLGQ